MNLFDIQSLSVKHRQKQLLSIESLSLPTDKLIAIIGANGAGKSTLIHALLGQVSGCEVTGRVQCRDQDVTSLIQAGKLSWVGQHERFEAPLTVLGYALLGMIPNLAWYQQPNQQAVDNAKQFLAEFDLLELAEMRIQTLSGGEKQRMAIVRALMQDTDVLLLDEPTNHLDIKHQRKLFAYLQKLVNEANKSIVMVLHSLTDAYYYADHVVALSNGEILAQGHPDEVMTAKNLKQMYEVDIHVHDTADGRVFV